MPLLLFSIMSAQSQDVRPGEPSAVLQVNAACCSFTASASACGPAYSMPFLLQQKSSKPHAQRRDTLKVSRKLITSWLRCSYTLHSYAIVASQEQAKQLDSGQNCSSSIALENLWHSYRDFNKNIDTLTSRWN